MHYACSFGIGKPISKIKFKGWQCKFFKISKQQCEIFKSFLGCGKMLVAGLVLDKIFYTLNYRSDKSPLQRLQVLKTSRIKYVLVLL